jgi:hypothetical protein
VALMADYPINFEAREYERDGPEPLCQRVLTMEKQLREVRDALHEADKRFALFAERTARELGF